MFRGRLLVLFMLLVQFPVTVAVAAHGEHHGSTATTVTAVDLKELTKGKDKPAIINVRSFKEYKFGHVSGAINIPEPGMRGLKDRLPKDKSALIILYARGDMYQRVYLANNLVSEMGYRNVKVFVGGILEWTDKHYPLKKGPQP